MRLIDADEFRNWLLKQKRLSKNYTVMMLDETPSIDPVKHGIWVLEMVGVDNDLRLYTCPFCGFSLPLNPSNIPNYCEYCGAKLENEWRNVYQAD